MQDFRSVEAILCGELLRGELRPSDCDLRPEDFSDAECRAVFEAATQLEEQRQEISLVSISDRHPALTDAAVGMVQMADASFGSDSLQHAGIVRDEAQRRRLAAVGRKLEEAAASGGIPSQMADEAWESMAAIVSHERTLSTQNLAVVADAVLKRRNNPKANAAVIPSGLPKLDTMLSGGFRAGNLYIIGARPGVGKSALLLSFVIHAAAGGYRALYVSLEMTAEQNAERYLAASSGLPVSWFVNDLKLSDRQLEIVADGQEKQSPSLIEEYDASLCTVGDIRRLARRMKASGGLSLIAVDYLGLLQPMRQRPTRNDEVSEMSRGLKSLAMELGIPVIAAHQLNRTAATYSVPELHHLRDSGSVEQDASAVILLGENKELPNLYDGICHLIVYLAKNRQGQVGQFDVQLNANLMRIEEE